MPSDAENLLRAVRSGVPITHARLRACPHDVWCVSTAMTGDVVFTHDKVNKQAEQWFSHVSEQLLKDADEVGLEVQPCGFAILVCVAGQWWKWPSSTLPAQLQEV